MARSDWDLPPEGKFVEDWFVRQIIEGLRGIDSPPISLTQTLTVAGVTTLQGALGVLGDFTIGSGPAKFTVGSTTGNTSIVGTLGVTGLTTLAALTATGNVALGDADADAHTMIGIFTFRNAAGTTQQLSVDSTNNRVVLRGTTTRFRDHATGLKVPLYVDHDNNWSSVGTATAIGGSPTAPYLQVVGRLYVAPDSANDTALQIRRSAAATVGWTIGVENSPVNLAFKDDSDTKVFSVNDSADTYQAVVTGDFNVTDDAYIAGELKVGSYFAANGQTPAARPTYTQTYSTATRTNANPTATALTDAFGTADGTVADVGAAFNQGTLNDNFQEMATAINALIVDLANAKQLLNGIVDDGQAIGLLA